MTTRIKWVAELNHVREVSLIGSANLRYWQDRLSYAESIPANCDGQARVMIVTAAGRFCGIQFREFSVSVLLTPSVTAPNRDEYFLAQAFNSNWLFALCERILFSTPYDHANVMIKHQLPAAISVVHKGYTTFHAAMRSNGAAHTRLPAGEHEESWEARVTLPRKANSISSESRMFFARLSGLTQTYPFVVGHDVLNVQSHSSNDVFRALLESQFHPREWIVRADARHAKSKTYKRPTAPRQENTLVPGEQAAAPKKHDSGDSAN